jgi:hypothetical protein
MLSPAVLMLHGINLSDNQRAIGPRQAAAVLMLAGAVVGSALWLADDRPAEPQASIRASDAAGPAVQAAALSPLRWAEPERSIDGHPASVEANRRSDASPPSWTGDQPSAGVSSP